MAVAACAGRVLAELVSAPVVSAPMVPAAVVLAAMVPAAVVSPAPARAEAPAHQLEGRRIRAAAVYVGTVSAVRRLGSPSNGSTLMTRAPSSASSVVDSGPAT